jgi:glutathione synthase/RimK-type ligase-like ATP-grasp enzyme
MRIAIQKSEFQHGTIPIPDFIRHCQKNNLDFEIVDAYDTDIVSKLRGFDIFIWYPAIDSIYNTILSASLLNAIESMGVLVYPNFSTAWHHDNKIAESFYLDANNIPIPRYWTFFEREMALNWARQDAQYPIIAKLKSGAGSNNVRMIKSSSEAVAYVKRMFGKGFSPAPSFIFKASSHYKATRGNWREMKNRITRFPDFVRRYFKSRDLPIEKGYVYFQEFIPNDGYDVKVCVLNGKISFLTRPVRKNDFRASGGGTIEYRKELVPDNVLMTARDTAEKLGFQKIGFDFVVDKRTGEGKIIEMCCEYSHKALEGAGGYWDFNLQWHEGGVGSSKELIDMLIKMKTSTTGGNPDNRS